MITCDEQESIYSLNFKIQDQYNLGKKTQQLKNPNGIYFFFYFQE